MTGRGARKLMCENSSNRAEIPRENFTSLNSSSELWETYSQCNKEVGKTEPRKFKQGWRDGGQLVHSLIPMYQMC